MFDFLNDVFDERCPPVAAAMIFGVVFCAILAFFG